MEEQTYRGLDKMVCLRCISNRTLSAEIRRDGIVDECSYCESNEWQCVPLTSLADRVAEVYERLVRLVGSRPDYDTYSEKIQWLQQGETPSQLISDMIECSEYAIAEDIVTLLRYRNYDPRNLPDIDWYDDTSAEYEIEVPHSSQLSTDSIRFCVSIKHSRRFFRDHANEVLSQILDPILDGTNPHVRHALRTIGPSTLSERFLFRGRVANDDATRAKIYASPATELGAPPPSIATGGRMNPAGISMFYGSLDEQTCVAELRVPVGGQAVVGCFELIRDIRVIDLSVLDEARNETDYFDPEYFTRVVYGNFIRGFHNEIMRSVVPGAESLEYLPTQVVAEYLWTHPRNPVAGIIFGSAQLSGEKKNIVLFPKTHRVEPKGPYAFEVTRVIRSQSDEDGDDPHEENVWHIGASSRATAFSPGIDTRVHLNDEVAPDPEEPTPATLRFNQEAISTHLVQRIEYRTNRYEVNYFEGPEDDNL